jgi:hypothetical protein
MFSTQEAPIARVLLRKMRAEMERQHPLIKAAPETRATVKRYCPHHPWPKQEAALALTDVEVFYGGAAAGGKSDWLLMSALQYVHVPGYAALILRRDFPRLSLAGAIMDRCRQWLANTDAKWSDKTVTFPSGAKIQFGYIDNPQDRFRYASSEYQFIGWDELTEFALADDESNPYLFMFSRLRAAEGLDVPLRMRAASNPGNVGHAWVKKRFIPADFRGIGPDTPAALDVEGRKFVPAAIRDNPAINEERYRANLAHLPPVTRERLMAGDWSVAESLQIPEAWIKFFGAQGDILRTPEGRAIDARVCRRFATIDTAGTSRDKAEETRGKPPSWSVVAVWDFWPAANKLFLRHVWRDRVGWNELKLRVPEVLSAWGCRRAHVENAHVGQPLADELKAVGIQVEFVGPMLPGMADGYRGAKLERAIASGLLTRLEQGNLLLPGPDVKLGDDPKRDWRPAYVLELTSWTGDPEQTSDQIDASSYAAWICKQAASSWGGTNVGQR